NHILKVIEQGYDRFDTVHRIKDGSLVDVEVSTSYLPTRGGIFTVFIHDISDKKRTIDVLEDERDLAQKQADVKSRFLSTMSHEIRTPIGGIIGMTHLLLETEEKPSVLDGLNKILNTAEVLSGIVNEILDYSRIESGTMRIENIEFNLRENLSSVAALFDVLAKDKGIEFTFDVDEAVPYTLVGDSFRIKQILTNLVGNAIKFTHKGKVRLAVGAEKVTSQNKVVLIFKIADTGIGISPEVLKTLSNPFVQADNSISRKYGGSGLGLYISKNLLKMMNSKLEIKSDLGVGSIFSFTLNLDLGTRLPTLSDKSRMRRTKLSQVFNEAIPHLVGATLLVAEDDHMNQIVISGYLKLANINFCLAENGEDCVKILKDNPEKFHGILMDVHMPIMSGIDATLKIREFNRSIPIIAMTAGVTPGEQKVCIANGMNAVLMKPIEPSKLAQLLNKYLIELIN
ncbi:MAG: ATP-binding protein, partial [Bdellovibrionales bacterium]